MASHVTATLKILCDYYTDLQGNPRKLNPVEWGAYIDGLSEFPPAALEAAAKQCIRERQWFPKVSELREILTPKTDSKALAELAWASVLQAIRRGGIYRGATFETGAVGEAMRQVFGSWSAACSFDTDSAGWTVRRQSFLAIFPTILNRPTGPVTLVGLHGTENPYQVPALQGAPIAAALPAHEQHPQLTHTETLGVLAAMAARRKDGTS
jgi:hypothetical protein